MLNDRIAKIQSINEQYDLENNAYISFSGGKDSTVLSALIDLALPNNKIPRVFTNTGIEYKDIVDFVKQQQEKDDRIVIIAPTKNIRDTLETFGYPFKSKDHSQKINIYQNSGLGKTVTKYIEGNNSIYKCPKSLLYNFTSEFTARLKCSDACCHKMKKEPAHKWSVENKRPITLTGIRISEGGLRKTLKNCVIFDSKGLKKFHPLLPATDSFIEDFIKIKNIEICKLYLPPYNFKRTGCKGCPFTRNLQSDLNIMEKLLPAERKQCEIIWKPVYDEYRRIGYRLKK